MKQFGRAWLFCPEPPHEISNLLFRYKNFNLWFLETSNTFDLKQNYKINASCTFLVWWWYQYNVSFLILHAWFYETVQKGTSHYPFTNSLYRKQYNHMAWNLQERSHQSSYMEQVKYGNCKINNSFSRQQQSLSPLFEHSKCT